MTTEARADLAAAVEKTVRATPGVHNVYRSGSLISNLVRTGAEVLRVRNDSLSMVAVITGERGVAVEASIGIDFHSSAGVILHAVHEAVDALLEASGLQRDTITLNVVYVQPPEAS
ncbi:hypothetical protein [Microbacterium sp. PMB16]|uniref:hypothetical protein n=1 Tax=Microbacterium sp. PMB16 TaxID=3120157 RepID=UPI003F4B974C